jgi:hypothetical protein
VGAVVTARAARRALAVLVVGMVLVVGDISIDGFDLLPDLLGWVLATVALVPLRNALDDGQYRGRVVAAAVLAGLLAVVSLPGRIDQYGVTLVLALAQPIVVAAAFLRFAEVAAVSLRRTWLVTVLALTAGLVLVLLTFATREAAVGFLAVFVVIPAVLHYLVALWRTRSAFA